MCFNNYWNNLNYVRQEIFINTFFKKSLSIPPTQCLLNLTNKIMY